MIFPSLMSSRVGDTKSSAPPKLSWISNSFSNLSIFFIASLAWLAAVDTRWSASVQGVNKFHCDPEQSTKYSRVTVFNVIGNLGVPWINLKTELKKSESNQLTFSFVAVRWVFREFSEVVPQQHLITGNPLHWWQHVVLQGQVPTCFHCLQSHVWFPYMVENPSEVRTRMCEKQEQTKLSCGVNDNVAISETQNNCAHIMLNKNIITSPLAQTRYAKEVNSSSLHECHP